MSEKVTFIRLRGQPVSGCMEWGEQDAPTMIKRLRDYVDHLRSQVAIYDAAADEDFHIVTARGVHVERNPRVIQEGRKA